jgi:hypothetical protein
MNTNLTKQKRDKSGKFVSDNPRTIIIRVTEEEKQLIEKFRQIQPTRNNQNDQFVKELQVIISNRVNNLEL